MCNRNMTLCVMQMRHTMILCWMQKEHCIIHLCDANVAEHLMSLLQLCVIGMSIQVQMFRTV